MLRHCSVPPSAATPFRIAWASTVTIVKIYLKWDSLKLGRSEARRVSDAGIRLMRRGFAVDECVTSR